MLRFLLDTNIAIYVIKKRPMAALQLFNEHAGHMAISSITLAELLHGASIHLSPSRLDHRLVLGQLSSSARQTAQAWWARARPSGRQSGLGLG
jgi:predicted nucleic acid-binding protein